MGADEQAYGHPCLPGSIERGLQRVERGLVGLAFTSEDLARAKFDLNDVRAIRGPLLQVRDDTAKMTVASEEDGPLRLGTVGPPNPSQE